MTGATLDLMKADQGDGLWSFEDLLRLVLNRGEHRTDRTGTGTSSLFAPPQLRYDLRDGAIPLITSKQVPWKMALREFMWMLSGSTDVNDLRKKSPAMAGIWDAWANDEGDVGPTYGAQYRDAGGTLQAPIGWPPKGPGTYGVDQLKQVILRLLETPDTRRALISLWSVPELRDMAIEPCMVLFQFSLRGENYDQLEVHIYQRSADLMLGVPFDLFQGGLLTHLIARELTFLTGRKITASALTWSAGDVHIYDNQIDATREQLQQEAHAEELRAKVVIDAYPSLRLLDGTLEAGHISIHDYNPQGPVDAGKPAV